MKKNIGLLIDTMNNGGAQRVVSRLSYMLNDSHNIYVILFEDTYNSYECTGTIINLNVKSEKNNIIGKLKQLLKRKKELSRIKKEYDLDVVISFLDSPNFVNILSAIKTCKTIISVRNYSKIENSSSLIGLISNLGIKLLYNKADKIVPVSDVIASNLIKQYGIEKEKVFTIYNPYDVDSIQILANEMIEPEYMEFMNSDKIIISVGRQMYQKGFWHLIKAFKIYNNVFPNSKLVIIGRDEQDGQLKKLVNQLALNENVLLLGYHNNPFKFIKKSSTYVLSSLFEGFPNAMVEAMACGCPVVSVDCKSGPREILYKNPNIDGVCSNIEYADFGILVPELEKEENWDPEYFTKEERVLAEAMMMLAENDVLREEYHKKSIIRAKEFNTSACKKSYQNIIG